MITVHTLSELRLAIKQAKQAGHEVGFVPTMGNLHEGHLSLVRAAKEKQQWVVASIFVNPLQFNDASDLDRYPRTLDQDQQQLNQADCDLLFAPNVHTMYPNGQANHSSVHVPEVSQGLCGGSRPGHFDGVATVVTKLFNIVQPDHAFFGEKDFQQVAVLQKMVDDLAMPVQIHRVPTARAPDGLALSSRNGYLTTTERQRAPELFQTLQNLAQAIQMGEDWGTACDSARQRLNQPPWRCDYIEICDAQTLATVTDLSNSVNQEWVIVAAAFLGNARLIDNLVVPLDTVESAG